ncbi:hypothetical protein KEM52_001740 [Ascosphaera acerosa]|nr:hypothetical protein KEM52_001740 [Ascosphaera acerosa]
MDCQQPVPAAMHKALAIPELLSQIFAQLLPSPRSAVDGDAAAARSQIHDLQACACVSRLWNSEATRQLWHNPCHARRDDIASALARIDRCRRQRYARIVRECRVHTLSDWEAKLCPLQDVTLLDNLDFPLLRRVTLVAGVHAAVVPPIRAAGVRSLVVDVQHWLYHGIYVNMVEVNRILQQIPKCFPNLESVTFTSRGDVSSSAIAQMTQRLPRLQLLDQHQMVVRN